MEPLFPSVKLPFSLFLPLYGSFNVGLAPGPRNPDYSGQFSRGSWLAWASQGKVPFPSPLPPLALTSSQLLHWPSFVLLSCRWEGIRGGVQVDRPHESKEMAAPLLPHQKATSGGQDPSLWPCCLSLQNFLFSGVGPPLKIQSLIRLCI